MKSLSYFILVVGLGCLISFTSLASDGADELILTEQNETIAENEAPTEADKESLVAAEEAPEEAEVIVVAAPAEEVDFSTELVSAEEVASFFGDNDIEIDKAFMEESPMNKLYAVRIMLYSPDLVRTVINYLKVIISDERKNFNKEALQNIYDARNVLTLCSPTVFSVVGIIEKVKDIFNKQETGCEPFHLLAAQGHINEAIMNSRVVIPDTYHGFVRSLFKSFLFPVVGTERLKIIFPDPSEYPFDHRQVDKALSLDTLSRIGGEGFIVVRGKSPIVNVGKRITKKYPGLVNVTEAAIAASTGDTDVSGANSLSTQVIKLIKEGIGRAFAPAPAKNETNKDIEGSMLMQLMADPAIVSVDPQLREFAEKLKIEYKLEEMDLEEDEFLEMLRVMKFLPSGNSCVKPDGDKRVVVDLHCLTKGSEGKGSKKQFREIVLEMEKGPKGFKFVQRLVTGIDSASLGVLRFIIVANKAMGIEKVNQLTKGFFSFIGRRSLNGSLFLTERVGKAAPISGANILNHLLKKVDFIGADKDLHEKILARVKKYAAPIEQWESKVLSKVITDEKKMAKLGWGVEQAGTRVDVVKRGIIRFVGAVLFVQVASVAIDVIDMSINGAESKQIEKTNSDLGMLGELVLFVCPATMVGAAVYSFGAGALRFLTDYNTPYLHEAFTDILDKPVGAIVGASSFSEAFYGKRSLVDLKVEEIEEMYDLPLKSRCTEAYIDDLDLDNKDKKAAYKKTTIDAISDLGRMIGSLYNASKLIDETAPEKLAKIYGKYHKWHKQYIRSYKKVVAIIKSGEISQECLESSN